jgi:hypothetical protein
MQTGDLPNIGIHSISKFCRKIPSNLQDISNAEIHALYTSLAKMFMPSCGTRERSIYLRGAGDDSK